MCNNQIPVIVVTISGISRMRMHYNVFSLRLNGPTGTKGNLIRDKSLLVALDILFTQVRETAALVMLLLRTAKTFIDGIL